MKHLVNLIHLCFPRHHIYLFYRWVERIDGLARFTESYVAMHTSFKKIYESSSTNRESAFHNVPWDANTKSLASGLLSKMRNFGFLVTLVISKELLQYLAALTTSLQSMFIFNVQVKAKTLLWRDNYVFFAYMKILPAVYLFCSKI